MIKKIIKKILNKFFGWTFESFQYRRLIFEYFIKNYNISRKNNLKILEIGPKDGADSVRLDSLKPSEIIFVELPEKKDNISAWENKIKSKHRFIYKNIAYLSREELNNLGKFHIIWCTGVLYHNPEQLRFLKRMYDLCYEEGVLVLESSTTRNRKLRKEAVIEIHFPETYNNTGTITHHPSELAINKMLEMVGFSNIQKIPCYKNKERKLRHKRAAFIAQKDSNKNQPFSYYAKSGKNEVYIVGEST